MTSTSFARFSYHLEQCVACVDQVSITKVKVTVTASSTELQCHLNFMSYEIVLDIV